MKKFLQLSFIPLFVFFASCNDKPKSEITSAIVVNGQLGDIKYSILKPAQFVKVNGMGRVLMDGRNIKNPQILNAYGGNETRPRNIALFT